ncbi:MAG: hypothetical protein IPP79_09790 [Chitinophagaceae bacterium]|nr:hypothetical protein [Chitinophagaceae bacterium]
MKSYRAQQSEVVITLQQQTVNSRFLLKVLLISLLLLSMLHTSSKAQCIAPTLQFSNPQLISGSDGVIGAVYLFPKVIPGVDAHITIMDMQGGASLAEIDNTTGAGYFDAFQPYVWAGANDTSFIDWKITFKQVGTHTDTTLGCLAVTAIDVDGDNSQLKEFVEAATPGSFAVDPFTNLVVTFDGVRSKAEGKITTIPLIDTNARQAMFQMNFTNINSLLYRNGAITTGGTQIRQTCIYFAPFFFQNWITLPAKLLSFNAKELAKGTAISWVATNEQDTRDYYIQKSTDGKNWKEIGIVAAKKLSGNNSYSYTDFESNSGITYYRLRQLDIKGSNIYSGIIRTGIASENGFSINHNTIFSNRINLTINAIENTELMIEVYGVNGQQVARQKVAMHCGSNQNSLQLPENLAGNMYILSVKNNMGQVVYKSKLIKTTL